MSSGKGKAAKPDISDPAADELEAAMKRRLAKIAAREEKDRASPTAPSGDQEPSRQASKHEDTSSSGAPAKVALPTTSQDVPSTPPQAARPAARPTPQSSARASATATSASTGASSATAQQAGRIGLPANKDAAIRAGGDFPIFLCLPSPSPPCSSDLIFSCDRQVKVFFMMMTVLFSGSLIDHRDTGAS